MDANRSICSTHAPVHLPLAQPNAVRRKFWTPGFSLRKEKDWNIYRMFRLLGGLLKGLVSLLSESKHWWIRIPGWVLPETKAMVWTAAHTRHCLYLQFSTEGVEGKPQLLASPWGGKELEHVSNIPVYQGAAQDTGLCITCFKALTRSHIV